MTRPRVYKRAIYGVFIAIFGSQGVEAQNICWIQKAVRTASGVNVYLSQEHPVYITHAGTTQRYIVGPNFTSTSKNRYGTTTAPFLSAQVGDKFFAMNGPEDSCSCEVSIKSGVLGIQASASLHLPGLVGSDATAFIVAEPDTTP
jgi:hypothetical protein